MIQMETSPFKFLDAYQKDDREIFFGRDLEVEALYQMTFQTNLILVYGMSGTGKTSIIQCGLANRFDSSDWFEIFIRRQENINKALVRELKHKDTYDSFQPDYDIKAMVKSLYLDHLRPIYLIFDQFEELFIIGKEAEQKAFFDKIKPLVEQPDLPCKIIIVMREEYLAPLTSYEKEIPNLFEKRLRIEPMTRLNAQKVILGTLRNPAFNIELETDSIAETIIDNVTEGKGRVQLTYLQVLLDKLYRMAAKHGKNPVRFTQDLVKEAGKIEDFLGSFLDEQLLVFSREIDNKDSALLFLKAFVSEKGTKLPVLKHDLIEMLPSMSLAKINIYLSFFINRRILKPIDNDQFELSHDTLADKIFRSQVKGIDMPMIEFPDEKPPTPFAGFGPYTQEMAVYFFGRTLETQDLFNKVVNETKIRTTLVFGPIGVGKTSLIQAGLLPRLKNIADVQYIKCSRRFVETANVQFLLHTPPQKDASESQLLETAYQWEKNKPPKSTRKIIIFDQFEEFYIWVNQVDELHHFYEHVAHLLDLKLNCDIIFVVRDEFFSHLQDFESMVPGILEEQVRVKHVDNDTGMRIVEKLAQEAELILEDQEVIQKIVENVCDDDGRINLTYLQLYMERLFQEATES